MRYKVLIGFKIVASRLFEFFNLTSKSSDKFGTLYNEEFKFYQSFFKNHKENLVVLDIGANSGDWALNFLEISKEVNTTVFCVEPYQNLKLEKLSRTKNSIKIFNIGIGERDKINITFSDFGSGGSAYSKKSMNNSTEIKPIKLISGDEFITSNKIIPTLIKIDVDGMDFEVIRSLRNSINKYRPLVQFEFTKRFALQAGYTLSDCVKFFDAIDYEVFVIDKNSKLKKIRFTKMEVIGIQTKNFIAIPSLPT